MIKKPRVTLIFFLQENLWNKKIVLISGFFATVISISIYYSVQFTDAYPLGVYEEYNCASEFNQLIINAVFP